MAPDRLPAVQEMIIAQNVEERKKALAKIEPMQKGDFKEIFKVMEGKPVTVRLIDPPLHEFLPKLEDLLSLIHIFPGENRVCFMAPIGNQWQLLKL